MLKRYLIGQVAAIEPLVNYLNDLDDPFYEELKGRVNNYFKDNNLHPRFNWAMYIKFAGEYGRGRSGRYEAGLSVSGSGLH